jgi:hypothetical protein
MAGYNSTIISKKKRCVSCGTMQFLFSKGRCKSCATIEDTNKRIAAHEEVEEDERSALKKESGMVFGQKEGNDWSLPALWW